MMKRLLPVAVFLVGAVLLIATGWGCHSLTGAEELGLVWSDEFDGPAGQSPDSTSWRFDIGTDWGNAQLEYDTDRPVNVSLDGNGNLIVHSELDDLEGFELNEFPTPESADDEDERPFECAFDLAMVADRRNLHQIRIVAGATRKRH